MSRGYIFINKVYFLIFSVSLHKPGGEMKSTLIRFLTIILVGLSASLSYGQDDFEVDIQRDSLQGNFLFSILAGRARSMGRLDEVYTLMDKLRTYDGLPLALMPIQYEVRP